jgi:hypothetical protein
MYYSALVIPIERYADYFQTLVVTALTQLYEGGYLHTARATPGSPIIQHDYRERLAVLVDVLCKYRHGSLTPRQKGCQAFGAGHTPGRHMRFSVMGDTLDDNESTDDINSKD